MEFKPIETQEQFDEMIKERLERAKKSAIPEDYEDKPMNRQSDAPIILCD